MKTHLLRLLVLIFLAFAGQAPAQDFNEEGRGMEPVPTYDYHFGDYRNPISESEPSLGDVHVTLASKFSSRYWGSIVGGVFYTGGAVNFTDLTVSKDNPNGNTYLVAGMINPLDTWKYDHEGGTEYYFAVGKTFNLWKGGPKNQPLVKIEAMLLYDAISRIKELDDDVIEQFVRIDLPRVPVVQPYVEGYHWTKTGDDSPQVGFFGRAGLHRQQPLGVKLFGSPLELSMDVSAGYCWGTFGTSRGLAYYRGVLGTEIRLNKRLSVTPFVVGQLPGGGQEDGRDFVPETAVYYNVLVKYAFKR